MKIYPLIFAFLISLNAMAQNRNVDTCACVCTLNLNASGFFEYSNQNHLQDLFSQSVMKVNGVKSAVIYYEKNPNVPSIHINKPSFFNLKFDKNGFMTSSEKDDILVIYQSNSTQRDSTILLRDNPFSSIRSGRKTMFDSKYFYFGNMIQKLNQLYLLDYDEDDGYLMKNYQETILDEKFRIQNKYDYSTKNDEFPDTTNFYVIDYDEQNYYGTLKQEKYGNTKDTIFFDKQWRPVAYTKHWMVSPIKKQSVMYNENNQLTTYNEVIFKPYSEQKPDESGEILTLKFEVDGEIIEAKYRKTFHQSTFIYNENGLLERITQTTDEGICEFRVYYQTY
jgi:hypothetical protein